MPPLMPPQSRPPTGAEEDLTRAQMKKVQAEIAQIEAETRESLAKALVAEIDLVEAQDDEAARKSADQFHHVYTFAGPVTDASVKYCILKLAAWHRNEPGCDIEIVFNSPGGAVIDGMALFDYILMLRSSGHRITTTALGMAASMAGILLQAGDHRVMGSEAWLLIHEGSFGAAGAAASVEDTVEWVKRIQKRILRIFAARSSLTEGQLARRWRRKDWWLDADDALKLGLVDEVRGLAV